LRQDTRCQGAANHLIDNKYWFKNTQKYAQKGKIFLSKLRKYSKKNFHYMPATVYENRKEIKRYFHATVV